MIAKVARGTRQDADNAVAAAKKAQQDWSKRTSIDRASFLKKMANVIRDNRVFPGRYTGEGAGKSAGRLRRLKLM